MKIDTILFDLDDTLILDESVAEESFRRTAELGRSFGANPERLHHSSKRLSLERWRASEHHAFCRRIGVNDIECLWGNFLGERPEVRALREWSLQFRVGVFSTALQEQSIADPAAAVELARAFARLRRDLQQPMPSALQTLLKLKQDYRLGLLTNGLSDVQREKLDASGFAPMFDAVVVSGEHDSGKPDPALFLHLLAQLGSAPDRAVMVGNSLERDVAGAQGCGIRTVWLEVPGTEEHAPVQPDFHIRTLEKLPPLLERLNSEI